MHSNRSKKSQGGIELGKKMTTYTEYIDSALMRSKYDHEGNEIRTNILGAIERAGDNKWWKSDDPLEAARGQLYENILIIPPGLFHTGLNLLLDRPVWDHEICFCIEDLREEGKVAIERRKKGIRNSDEQKLEAYLRGFSKGCELAEEICSKNDPTGKKAQSVRDALKVEGYDVL